MPSSTFSSDKRFVVALALTFGVLVTCWELVLRKYAGANVDFVIDKPRSEARSGGGKEWVLVGNCLVMTGVSARRLNEQLGDDPSRHIRNIALHEQSPIAFFQYMREAGDYPDVVIANVSSWLNGTNFEQESEIVAQADPLGLLSHGASPTSAERSLNLQGRAERTLVEVGSHSVRALGRRYHLFDYALFVGRLAMTANLEDALYQLNMQSWYRVTSSETDGDGFVGVHVDYRQDWNHGLEQMAERSLQRLRLSRLLTERYWELLEEQIRHVQAHRTTVILLRMPEHPRIREFNETTYQLNNRLNEIKDHTGAPVLDLARLGVADGVRLFDGVHPDADAAKAVTDRIAVWLSAHHLGDVASDSR